MPDDVVVSLLRTILARLGALQASVDELRINNSRPTTKADRAKLAALLPIVERVTGNTPFLARELFMYAEAITPDGAALRTALGDTTANALGRLLRRADGVANFRVERAGTDTAGVLWSVRRRSPKHA